MIIAAAVDMGKYELPLIPTIGPLGKKAKAGAPRPLAEPFLINNALWFCRLRWVVIAALLAFGIFGLIPGVLESVGLRSRDARPFAAAAMLIVENILFLAHARMLARSPERRRAKLNLWGQIVFDMIVLTLVVHFVGSLESFVSFAYLFHIVLACIFLSRPESLAVTILASALYSGCVWAEISGVLPLAGLLEDRILREHIERAPGMPIFFVAAAVGVWFVVWYLASHLSRMVQERDSELAETNRRLEEAQEEKTRHMLRTTHELKAPFAAIHANTQLLLEGYCGSLPAQAVDVIRRIAERCRRLAGEIQEMLQLANLRTSADDSLRGVELDVAELLQWSIAQVQTIAQERGVLIEHRLEPVLFHAGDDQMKMLFSNLLSNAVNYSYKGGRVYVECLRTQAGGATVTIQDQGIGIVPEKLPHIFDEYYRTAEAAAHNRESTGLGLAIVREVSQKHGIRVVVESAPGVGTQFFLDFASAEENQNREPGHRR